MPQCCVPYCTNRPEKTSNISYYSFPKDEKFKKKWLKAIRRDDWTPTAASVVCSSHFSKGKEFGPDTFQWNVNKHFDFPDTPVQKPRKRALIEIQEPIQQVGAPELSTDESTDKDKTIELLSQQITDLVYQIDTLKMRTKFEHICTNDNLVYHYTGLRKASFMAIVDTLKNKKLKYINGWNVCKIPFEDQLLLTLMKLRCNFTVVDLSVRFDMSPSTCVNIYLTLFHALHKFLYMFIMKDIPSAEQTRKSLPACCLPFPNCRQIWDCFDIFIECPRSDLTAQKSTYSQYRGGNTLKSLLSVSPNGVILMASELFGGSVSDKYIVLHSGILKTLEAGDLVLADKGFLVHDILPPNVSINIPPFLDSCSGQFTIEESLKTQKIARARIHVERAIQRIKEFSILSKMPYQHHKYATIILQLCCALVNLQPPIIAKQECTNLN